MNIPAVVATPDPERTELDIPFIEEEHPDYLALNQGQRSAVEAVFQFLFSNDKEFMISGPAGTGKTHLMKFIMDHTLIEYQRACQLMGLRYVDYEIALTATTNKAAEVLAVTTGFPTGTIHSFLGLKVNDNYETGKSQIQKTKAWTVHQKKLIFIDEASMIDSELHRYILQGTDKTCKVIYLGDHCQMAPVFETISPVYKNPKRFVKLNQPMRNANQPALMALCSQLRQTVETLQFQPIQEVPGVIDYLDNNQAFDFVKQTFAQEDPPARILAFSNARVLEYNQYIRDLRGYPETFTVGEVLVNNNAFTMYQADTATILSVEREVKIEHVDPILDTRRADSSDPDSTFETYSVVFSWGKGSAYRADLPVDINRVRYLMNFYAKQKRWDRFYWLKNTFPDFRQKDAATVYKAQGSTYETVFLDLTNIGTCKHNDQLARMLYVGASRATTRLVLYGELPKRLFI